MRRFLRALRWPGYFVAIGLFLGAVYQQIGSLFDKRLAPPASEMVDVGGHNIFFRCTGSGQQTYLLDAGAGAWSREYWSLAPKLAQSARVCIFDRPGLGWSDTMPGGHDVAAMADQVFSIVHAAKIQTPFIYVGHSLGANVGEIYQQKHPKEIAALVLLEPGYPKWLLEGAAFRGGRAQALAMPDCDWKCPVTLVAGYLGWPRIVAHLVIGTQSHMRGDVKDRYIAGLGRVHTPVTIVATLSTLPRTAYQIDAIKSFGDTPVITFASARPTEPDKGESDAQYRADLANERDWKS